MFASVKQGREHALVSILVKQGHGVRDAWVARSLTRGEVDDMLVRITTEMPHHETTAEDAAALLSVALADGTVAGTPPPLGLVQAVAMLAPVDVAPTATSATELLSTLLADAHPTLKSPEATARVLRTSGQWLACDPSVQSWFENGDEVGTARKGHRKKADRIAAITKEVLDPRRAFWAEVIAWSAFARRGGGDDTRWAGLAMVARESAGHRPLIEIPVATFIAVQTDAAASA